MKNLMEEYEEFVKKYKSEMRSERIRTASLTHEIQCVLDSYNDVEPTDIPLKEILSLPLYSKVQISNNIVYERKSDKIVVAYIKKGAYVKPHFHSDFNETFIVLKGELLCNTSSQVIKAGEKYFIPKGVVHSHTAITDVINEIVIS